MSVLKHIDAPNSPPRSNSASVPSDGDPSTPSQEQPLPKTDIPLFRAAALVALASSIAVCVVLVASITAPNLLQSSFGGINHQILIALAILSLVAALSAFYCASQVTQLPAETHKFDKTVAYNRVPLSWQLLEFVDVGLALWDHDQRLIACNRHFRQLVEGDGKTIFPGLQFSKLCELEAGRCFPKAADLVKEQWIAAREDAFAEADGHNYSYRNRNRWLRRQEIALPNQLQLTLIHDDTGATETEKRLKETRERYALAMHGANEGLWDWDLLRGQIYVSPRLRQFIGEEEDEFTSGRRWLRLIRPSDRPAYCKALRAHLKGESRIFECEYRVLLPGKGERWVYDRALALRNSTGQAYRMAGSIGDITERKQAQLALSEAKKAAEAANVAKARFLSNMSHELRTPLNAIIGFSDILAKATETSEDVAKHSRYAEDIHRAGEHLLSLVEELLDMGEASSHTLSLLKERVQLRQIVADAVGVVRYSAEQKRVTLDIQDCSTMPAVQADISRLRRVFCALLDNAVKFSRQNATVHLIWRQEPSRLTVSISDTGIGMTKEHLEVAKRPFEQIEGGLNRKYDGAGVGLPLAIALMQLHGGSLEIDTEENVGTTVSLHFPAAMILAEATENPKYRPGAAAIGSGA